MVCTLCPWCAEEVADSPYCGHSEEDRALSHETYCTPELVKALDKGYHILSMDDVWDWPESRHSTELFHNFLMNWIRAKIASSGFPLGCDTEDQSTEYVAEQNAHYNMDLKVAEIEKNPTRRTLAKNNANSFWGHWGLLTNKSNMKFSTNMEEIVKLHSDPNVNIADMLDVGENLALITY